MSRALVAAAIIAAALPASAQEVRFPQVNAEIDMSMIGVGTTRATNPAQRGTSVFLFGEVAMGLSLTENFSIQGVLATEPIGEGDSTGGFPNDGVIGFRRQALFIEQLYAQWKPDQALTLQGGILVAPFGRGYHDFPGILASVRAHEVYLVDQSLGAAGTWTYVDDPRFGTHDVSAAIFTLDRTFLTGTYLTPRRCCSERYERYNRNTVAQGGPGNNGTFNNFAVALDGDQIPFLPGFSYHLAVISQAPGSDGTAREWRYAAGLRYEHRWNATQSTLVFAEGVQFRNAGGRPRVEVETLSADPETGEEVSATAETTLSERLTFTTLGVQHRIGRWRGTLAWQQLRQKRSIDPVPGQDWFEGSIGRELGSGFSLDVGYQYARIIDEETGQRGTSHAVLARLRYTGGL
ncbi:hypothetical protein [Roseomonas fluvialis]|uniref:Uncharacterized protein n=1 Tax=Roseomonas fluvialis TaxID=1750527 RepID=A0ABM7XZW0_9PROT|nr:hypothetical protein [Roseomonas fluvialis]BDG71053.1 hypothetical protein Rmf_09820 [Roseomonas fluvialis]